MAVKDPTLRYLMGGKSEVKMSRRCWGILGDLIAVRGDLDTAVHECMEHKKPESCTDEVVLTPLMGCF